MKKQLINNFILGCALTFCMCLSSSSLFAQLKPQAINEINLISAEKKTRTATEVKLASQLLQAYRESKGKPMVAGVNLEKMALPSDDNGNILVDINAKIDDSLLNNLKALGVNVVFSSAKYNAIRAYVAPTQLLNVASLSGISFIKTGAKPHLKNSTIENKGLNVKKKESNQLSWNNNPSNKIHLSFEVRAERIKNYITRVLAAGTGTAVSQGDHTMKVDSARKKYGFDGKGIRIGVISDTYNYLAGAATDVKNGELPGSGNTNGYTTPVTVVQDYTSSGTDEGRAMLQIVHDLVPNAQLFFATAYNGDAGFASNIEALANNPNNCDVIVDDVGYSDEPAFQDGPIAQAINYVTKKGVLYFSSAGNGGSYKYNFSSVWEGDFNPTTSTMTAFTGKKVHNFGTAAKPIIGDSIVTVSGDYTLMWADPLGGSTNDYDLYLISKTGGSVIAQSTNVQTGTQDPFEEISPTTAQDKANYMLVVVQNSGAQNRAFRLESHLDGQGRGMTHTTNGGTDGHAAADSTIGVAACDASKYYPNTFTTASTVENFSSDGPRRIFYNPDTTVITAGNFLYATSGGRLLGKPNITAADGVATNLTGTTSFSQFYGTSAAAPHAAAVAVLLKSARPNISATLIKKLLYSTAIDIEAAGFDYNSGNGIVNALAAMDALAKTAINNVITSFSPAKGSFGTVVTIRGIGLKGSTAVNFGGTPAASFTVLNDSTISAIVGHGSSGYVSVSTIAGITTLPGFTYSLSSINITLNVDLTNYLKAGNTIGSNGIRISGNFSAKGDSALPNWSPTATSCALTKGTSNNWSIKVTLPDTTIGSKLLYKFVNNDISSAEGVDLSSTILGGCGIADADGTVYRSLVIPPKDSSFNFCWDQCSSCNLTASLPTITTSTPSNVTLWSATVGGNLTNTGGATVTEEGVVYGTTPNPTTQNSLYQFTLSPSSGNFTYNLTGLTPNTTYYVRGFAVNTIGTSYGSQYSFTTLPVVSKPSIASFSPTSASMGALITINGKNFIGVSSVSFGNTVSPIFSILNDSTITAIVSSGSTGSISVTNLLGTASIAGFTFISNTSVNIANDYTVSGYFFHPTSARAISSTKTITQVSANTYQAQLGDLGGSNYNFQFQLDSNNNLINWLNIGSTPAVPASGFMTADNPGNTAFTVSPLPGESPYLQATYNNTYNPITQTLYMHYGYGTGSTNQNGYTRQVYEIWSPATPSTGAPTISSISPTSGTTGTPILIRGSGFSSITNTYTGVTFGSKNGVNEADSIAILSDSVLVAWVGNGKSGNVYVTNTSGTASITGFTYLSLPSIANSGWVNVGQAGFTNGTAINVTSAVGNDNIPYVAYIDSATSQVIVMKYANTTWSLVGTAVSTGKASNLNLVLDKTNNPIVAFIDSSNASAMTVKKYTANTWQTLGSGALTSVTNYFSLAIDTSNIPYIFNGRGVYKLQNSVWNSVGSTTFSNAKNFYNIAFDKTTNTPFVVFDSADGRGYPQASVMKYSGGNWSIVGQTTFTSAVNGIYFIDIAIDNKGVPYVSFQEDNGFERASVYKYANANWSIVGSPRFSKGHIYNPSLAINKKNNPVLLYDDFTYNNSGTVMSFTDTSNWKTVGTRGFVPNNYFTRHALSIDTANAPIIVFYDQTQGGKASMLRYGTSAQNFTISGNIKNPLGTIIPTVSVTLNDTGKTVTSIAGNYGFTVASGSSCKIVPSKNNDKNVANGVNGTDISLIQSHILKKVLLNTPYKLIAADVNNDGAVNGTDIALIKSMVLKHITSFAGNRLWAFVDSSYSFPTPTKPFPYPDSIKMAKLNGNQANQSFIGVKLGDVNFDWNAAILGINGSIDPIELFNDHITVSSSSTEVRIPIKVRNFKNIMGMQYTLNFNKDVLELKSVENNNIGADYNMDFVETGKIPFLWVDASSEARTIADSTILFELVFNKKGSFTNEDIILSSDITDINAFDGNYAPVGIRKGCSIITENVVVTNNSQVYPNPAKDAITILGNHIKEVQVLDNLGKTIRLISLKDAENPNIKVVGLMKGVYHLRIKTTSGMTSSVGFVKE